MRLTRWLLTAVAAGLLGLPPMTAAAQPAVPAPGVDASASVAAGEACRLSFDDVRAGELPRGWKVDATNPKGEPAEWQVVADDHAPSKPNVLSITKIADDSSGHFNLCWTPAVQLKDGTLEVKIRANTGKKDQGGGLIWRAADAMNYYVARYNPLETNFRLYYVKNGKRVQLAGADGLGIKTGEWFTIKIVVHGEKMEGWLDGKKLLEVTDKTFTGAGGVGFWSKADAASSFDDFAAEPAQAGATAKPASE
ncbi:MAG: family 16 glycoside hydrolase [Candidatus Brocadiia bacterium]